MSSSFQNKDADKQLPFSDKVKHEGKKPNKEKLEVDKKAVLEKEKMRLKKAGEKSLEDAIKEDNRSDLVDLYFDSFEIDDDLFERHLNAFTPKPLSRTYPELRLEAIAAYEKAVEKMKFGVHSAEKMIAPKTSDEVRETEPFKVDKRELTNTLFDFAFIFGNYNNQKHWIKLVSSNLCIAFPDLIEGNKHAVFVTMFAEKISEKLVKFDNAIISILKRKNIEVKKEKRKYCFAKGHLLCDNDKDRNACIKDLQLIFSQMKLTQDKRDFSKLRFFTD